MLSSRGVAELNMAEHGMGKTRQVLKQEETHQYHQENLKIPLNINTTRTDCIFLMNKYIHIPKHDLCEYQRHHWPDNPYPVSQDTLALPRALDHILALWAVSPASVILPETPISQ